MLDPKTLDGLVELGGEDFLQQMLSSFVLDAERLLDRAKTALTNGDHAELKAAAHALQGCAAMVGATEVTRACRGLLQLSAQEPQQARLARLDETTSAYRRARATVGKVEAGERT